MTTHARETAGGPREPGSTVAAVGAGDGHHLGAPRTHARALRAVRTRKLLSVAAVSLLLAPLLACGVKGMPRPPEDTAPRPPGDVSAVRDGSVVKLAWSRPTESMDGQKLGDLASFVVERRGPDGQFAEIGRVAVEDNERIRPRKHFAFVDEAPPAGATDYRVRAVTSDGAYTASVASAPASSEPAAGSAE